MGNVKCYDVVSMVTEEATTQFSPIWIENAESVDVLKQYCDIIDNLAEEFDGISFEVDVDRALMCISIKMECEDVLIESKGHDLYKLMNKAKLINFEHASNDSMYVEFVFPGIWVKA